MNDEVRHMIAEAYQMRDEQGHYLPVTRICAEFNIYPTQLYSILDKLGTPKRTEVGDVPGVARGIVPGAVPSDGRITIRGIKRKVTEYYSIEFKKRIATEYLDEGLTGKEISDLHGIPYTHVLKVLHDARVQVIVGVGSRRTWIKERQAIIATLRDTDLDIDSVCIKFGVSKGILLKAVAREGETMVAAAIKTIREEGKVASLVDEVLKRVREELKIDVRPGSPDFGTKVQSEMFDDTDYLVMTEISKAARDERIDSRRPSEF